MAIRCHCGRGWKMTNRCCCAQCYNEAWERQNGLLIEPSQSGPNREKITQPAHDWRAKVEVKADGA